MEVLFALMLSPGWNLGVERVNPRIDAHHCRPERLLSEFVFVGLMTSDRKLKASREGSN